MLYLIIDRISDSCAMTFQKPKDTGFSDVSHVFICPKGTYYGIP